MKKYKRIEITAFRRRVAIILGEAPTTSAYDDRVILNDIDSSETIEIESDVGQAILTEAVRMLETTISRDRTPGSEADKISTDKDKETKQ